MLYQLSYTHHVRSETDRPKKRVQGPGGCSLHPFPHPLRMDGGRSYAPGAVCLAAMLRAVSESGPGCGTKTASR